MVLVINSGSSSVKFEVFERRSAELRSAVRGEVERIGTRESRLSAEVGGSAVATDAATAAPRRIARHVRGANHAEALSAALDFLWSLEEFSGADDLEVAGHRVVHGGSRFTQPTLIDLRVLDGIREVGLLAPLHTAANVAGIEAAMECLPDVPQVAIFDTAFHRTMPPRACEYALPRDLARENGLKRYGFHGTSHAYVARRAAELLGKPLESLDLITLHLGAGASACAIHEGRSIDTSMGMTPLEGLVMGTRCGDVDPALPMLLGELTGRDRREVNRLLNSESGLLGMCGAADMREVHRLADEGNADAEEALDLYCYRAKKYVGAYFAALGRLDALVFTAGIGENDAEVRERICEGLGRLGIEIDAERNRAPGEGERVVSREGVEVAVLVVPTQEEKEIARLALSCLEAACGLEEETS
ncbi:MAG: acetate/propionate family kinase [Coriobacteriia bacterium]